MKYFRTMKARMSVVVLAAVLTTSSCLKKEDNIEPTPAAVAYLVNATPKSDFSSIYINNKLLDTAAFRFTNKSQTFLLTEDNHELSLSKHKDTVKYARKRFDFLRDKYYTLFVVPTETSVEFIQKEEFTVVPSVGKMKIRFANFLYGSPKLNLHVKDTGNAFQDIEFKGITSFIELSAGSVNLQLKNSADTTQIKLDQTMGPFEAGKSYTIIAGGNWNTGSGIGSPLMWKVLY